MILENRPTYDEIVHLANLWEGKPKRKGALADVKKIQTTMELKRDLQTKTDPDIRHDYAGIRRASEVAFRNRLDTTGRIRRWIADGALAIGGSALVSMAWVLILRAMGV